MRLRTWLSLRICFHKYFLKKQWKFRFRVRFRISNKSETINNNRTAAGFLWKCVWLIFINTFKCKNLAKPYFFPIIHIGSNLLMVTIRYYCTIKEHILLSFCIEESCDCKIKLWAKSSFCWESLQSRPNSQSGLSHCSPAAPSLGRYPGSCNLFKSINSSTYPSHWAIPMILHFVQINQ